MVEILCPHCEEEIVLDDDAFGEFECPNCENGFEWGEEPKVKAKAKSDSEPMSGIVALSHALHGAGALMLIIGLFVSWITIGGFLEITPFGMRVCTLRIRRECWLVTHFGEGEGSILAITGFFS